MDSLQHTAQKIIDYGWRQGSVFRINDNTSALTNDLYLILSQDCDICHSSFEDDPFVEVINCGLIEDSDLDGNLTHGKNPRRIQFQLNDNKYYECQIKSRKFIDRKLLATLQPEKELIISKKTLENLIRWINKRYDRDAFPFEFDKRLKNRKKLKKILEKQGENVIGIFIQLNTEDELPESDAYILDLVMLIDLEGRNNVDNICTKLADTLEIIYQLLVNNNGIEVLSSYSMKTPLQITLGEFINLRQLDFDYLSFRDFPNGTLL